MKKLPLLGISSLLLIVTSFMTAHAAQFSYQFSDTVSSSDIMGINMGDNAVITVTLDNGGSSNQNQVWTSAELVSVQFDFNDGFRITTFKAPFDIGLISSLGSYTTDNMGNLTAVSMWADSSITSDFMTNGPMVFDYYWNLNGTTNIYGEEDFDIAINNLSRRIIDPNSWSEVQPVPVPAAAWLFMSGLIGFVWKGRKARQSAV